MVLHIFLIPSWCWNENDLWQCTRHYLYIIVDSWHDMAETHKQCITPCDSTTHTPRAPHKTSRKPENAPIFIKTHQMPTSDNMYMYIYKYLSDGRARKFAGPSTGYSIHPPRHIASAARCLKRRRAVAYLFSGLQALYSYVREKGDFKGRALKLFTPPRKGAV